MLVSFIMDRERRFIAAESHPRHRRAWQILLISMALSVPASSSAQSRWDKNWDVIVNGVPINVQSFTSDLKPAAIAKRLIQTHGALSRFHLADGRLLLHGLEGDAHWVAHITGHPDGSQGFVSALYFGSSDLPQFAAMDAHRQAHPMYGRLKHRFDFGTSALVGLAPIQGNEFAPTSSILAGSGPWTMASEVDSSMAVVVAIGEH